MVRVFAAYHYRGQSVHPVNADDDYDDDDDYGYDMDMAEPEQPDYDQLPPSNDDRSEVATSNQRQMAPPANPSAATTSYEDPRRLDTKAQRQPLLLHSAGAADFLLQLEADDANATVLATTLMDDDHLIVAKANHCIEIVPLLAATAANDDAGDDDGGGGEGRAGADEQQPQQPLLSFPTLDRVHRLLYCKQGNYIITLESATGASSSQSGSGHHPNQRPNSSSTTSEAAIRCHCRIYTNWWTVDPDTGCYNTAIRARVAAKVSPDSRQPAHHRSPAGGGGGNQQASAGRRWSANASAGNTFSSTGLGSRSPQPSGTHFLDVIELPPDSSASPAPVQIACCPVSGNVAVADAGGDIRLWRLRVCTGAGSVPYIDFRPAGRWRLRCPFAAVQLQLAENWLAAASAELVVVAQLAERRRGGGGGGKKRGAGSRAPDANGGNGCSEDSDAGEEEDRANEVNGGDVNDDDDGDDDDGACSFLTATTTTAESSWSVSDEEDEYDEYAAAYKTNKYYSGGRRHQRSLRPANRCASLYTNPLTGAIDFAAFAATSDAAPVPLLAATDDAPLTGNSGQLCGGSNNNNNHHSRQDRQQQQKQQQRQSSQAEFYRPVAVTEVLMRLCRDDDDDDEDGNNDEAEAAGMKDVDVDDERHGEADIEDSARRNGGANGKMTGTRPNGRSRRRRTDCAELEADGDQRDRGATTCVIQLRTVLGLRQRDVHDPLRCVQLRPIYMGDSDDDGGSRQSTVANGDQDENAEADAQEQASPQMVNGGRGRRKLSSGLADVGGAATLISRCGAGRLVGVTVLVATANDGYVYQFSTNDKWTIADSDSGLGPAAASTATLRHQQPAASGGGGSSSYHFVCTYPFTAPALAVHLNDTALHVLTDRGLETYTLRTGHRLFGSSAYEYLRPTPPPLRLPPPTGLTEAATAGTTNAAQPKQRPKQPAGGRPAPDASPSADDPVSLIGLRPFMNVCAMHGADGALVLLAGAPRGRRTASRRMPVQAGRDGDPITARPPSTTATSSAICWTAYRLQLPDAAQLATDLLELADQHRNRPDAAATYALLAAEAHMVARVGREWLQVRRCGNCVRLRPAAVAEIGGQQQLDALYAHTCSRLGDFCVLSDSREEYCQAAGYYAMAGLGIVDVLQRALRREADTGTAPADAGRPGLVHTLKSMLLRPVYEPHEMTRLLATQLQRPSPPPPSADSGASTAATSTVAFLDALLEVLLAEAPDDIAPLMLRHSVLRDAAASRLCAALRTKQRPTAEDRFCGLWQRVRAASKADSSEASDNGAPTDYDGVGDPADEWSANLQPAELCAMLVQHWSVLFEQEPHPMQNSAAGCRAKRRQPPKLGGGGSGGAAAVGQLSFSDLTESYLLVRQEPGHQRAVANAFVRISVEQPTVSPDEMLRLLLDYLATRVGQAGYQTAQLVLTAVLEAFCWRVHQRQHRTASAARRQQQQQQHQQQRRKGGHQQQRQATRGPPGSQSQQQQPNQNNQQDRQWVADGGFGNTPDVRLSDDFYDDPNDAGNETDTVSAADEDEPIDFGDYDGDDDDADDDAFDWAAANGTGHIQHIALLNGAGGAGSSLVGGATAANAFADVGVHGEAIKMLVRIYLGQLKRNEMLTAAASANSNQAQASGNRPMAAGGDAATVTGGAQHSALLATVFTYMRQHLDEVHAHHKSLGATGASLAAAAAAAARRRATTTAANGHRFQPPAPPPLPATDAFGTALEERPILYADRRPAFCDSLPPFQPSPPLANTNAASASPPPVGAEARLLQRKRQNQLLAAARVQEQLLFAAAANSSSGGGQSQHYTAIRLPRGGQRQQPLAPSSVHHDWPLHDSRRTAYKLQSLLASGQLGRDVLQECIYFAEANASVVGCWAGCLALLLPDDRYVEYWLSRASLPGRRLSAAERDHQQQLRQQQHEAQRARQSATSADGSEEEQQQQHDEYYGGLRWTSARSEAQLEATVEEVDWLPDEDADGCAIGWWLLLDWAKVRLDGRQKVCGGGGDLTVVEVDRKWQTLLRRVLAQKERMVEGRGAAYFERLMRDLLQYLVDTKRLSQIVKIFPVRPLASAAATGAASGSGSNPSIPPAWSVGAAEDEMFSGFLQAAIDRDRAERLGEMIKTTGYQLNETYNRNKQFFN